MTLRRIISIPGKLLRIFSEHGFHDGIGTLINFARDRRADRSFGVTTNRSYLLRDHGVEDENYVDYGPITYAALRAAIRACSVTMNGSNVFIDFGAGRGRVLLEAATHPLKRVIGVEFMPELAEQAEQNIATAREHGRLRCDEVEVLREDATEFVIPPEATILHFFNPFRGPILDRVVENLAASLSANPRKIFVLFANPDDFDRILKNSSPIPTEWIKNEKTITWPLFRTDENELGNVYRNYVIDSTNNSTT
ncbi:MAG: 16S rRNA G966 N2-methylase RsmD [Verrucomicrobiales bacterium]|jgi:16S rRNA G966 N2-methylase RsmD